MVFSSDIEKFHVTAIVIVVLIKIVIYLITATLIIITGKYMDVSEARATTSISLIILFMGTPTYPPPPPCHIFQNKQEELKKKTTHHTHHHVLDAHAEG